MISNYTLQESERKLPGNTRRAERAPGDGEVVLSIYIRPRPDSPGLPGLDELSKIPPAKRAHLTHEEFAGLHGALQSDIDLVIEFASSHGLSVLNTSIARRVVILSGTVAQANAAFGVELHYFEANGQKYRGREGRLRIPEQLSTIVQCVLGLDSRPVKRTHGPRTINRAELFPGGGASRIPMTPVQMAKLYGFPSVDAGGQTIAVMEFEGGFVVDPATQRPTDIDTFFSNLNLPPPVISVVLVDGATNKVEGNSTSVSSSDLEVTADIDVAAAAASGSRIAIYFAPNDIDKFADAFSTAVHDTQNKPSVITCSWNAVESQWSEDNRKVMEQVLVEAANLGITVLVCTMDDGTNCGMNDGKAYVEYPATAQGVIACGGTRVARLSGTSFTEVTWNDGSGQATGGGISDFVDLPVWQSGANIPPSINDGVTRKRGIPDVAGNASAYSGYTITLYGGNYVIYGTSFVAPLYAALVALINAKLNKRIGYINPWLYKIAEIPGNGAFRDIHDDGNNGVSYPTGTSPKYLAGAGWDACTGWGSIVGEILLQQLQQLV